MGCESASRNATAPESAFAPGSEGIDPAAFAGSHETDPRLSRTIPGFDAPFFQAGLAGYSDAAMRIVARRQGCPVCVTEALLDRTLLAGGKGFAKADLGELHDNIPGGSEDHPLVGQIMGSDPGEMAAAAIKMVEQGRRTPRAYRELRSSPELHTETIADRTFAAIDVNLACPVKKISKKARGGHWLREPEGAIAILAAVRAAVPESIPCTVKLRRGSDDSPEAERNFYRIYDALHDLGYAWAVVHGRTVEQKYVGPSRWTFLRDLVRARPDHPVLGSGDVWSAHDIFRMIAYTGVSAVSVARGCIGNPWVFRQAQQLMQGLQPLLPTIAEQREVLLQHFAISVSINGERTAGLMMRKFGVRFSTHHPNADEVRRAFIAVSSHDEWKAVIDQHYTPLDAANASSIDPADTIPSSA